MARVKRGVTSRAKHKKVLKAVKGQWGRRKNTIRVAKQAMEKALQYAYRDRRNKKRDFKLTYKQLQTGVGEKEEEETKGESDTKSRR
jgi:large subunit ribosomal protein L20